MKKIYGLIGYPVKHSFSPAMHNAAFLALGIDAKYRTFEVPPQRLKEFLLDPDAEFDGIRAGDVSGFNITIPHKVKADQILEEAFPFDKNATSMNRYLHYVKLLSSVNTVKRDGGKLEYYNTDAEGFLVSLEKDLGFTTANKNVLVTGCGGAGRAVIAALSWRENKVNNIFVYDVSKEAMQSAEEHFRQFDFITNKLKFISKEQRADKIKNCQLLVNASPVGMEESDGSVVDKEWLRKGLYVYDVIYNRETQLIKDAKEREAPCVDGRGMLLYQGTAAFGLWTGKEAPVDVMRKALEEEIKKCRN